MFQDPLNPHTLPPARYTLESDSEDEEGQGLYPGSKGTSELRRESPKCQVTSELRQPAQRLIVAVGTAADYVAQLVDGKLSGDVELGHEKIGQVLDLGDGEVLVLFGDELGHESCSTVAEELMSAFPVPTLAVSTYSPPSYISLEPGTTRGYAPIRTLSTSKSVNIGSHVGPFKSPNYISGLAASLISMAAHPKNDRSLTAMLLPLSLSTLAPKDVLAAVSPFAKSFGQPKDLSQWELKPHPSHRPRVTEDSQSMYV